MAAYVLNVGDHGPDAQARTGSDRARNFRTAHENGAADRPGKPASLAEFAHDLCSPLSAIYMVACDLRDGSTSDDRNEDIDTGFADYALNYGLPGDGRLG